jgi:hypothetical protein
MLLPGGYFWKRHREVIVTTAAGKEKVAEEVDRGAAIVTTVVQGADRMVVTENEREDGTATHRSIHQRHQKQMTLIMMIMMIDHCPRPLVD